MRSFMTFFVNSFLLLNSFLNSFLNSDASNVIVILIISATKLIEFKGLSVN